MHVSSKFNDSSFIQHSHWVIKLKFNIKWKLYYDSIQPLSYCIQNFLNGPRPNDISSYEIENSQTQNSTNSKTLNSEEWTI